MPNTKSLTITLDWLRNAVAIARILALPFAISIFAGAVLAFPPQTLEHYRLLIWNLLFDLSGNNYRQILLSHAPVVVSSCLAVIAMASGLVLSAKLLTMEHKTSFPHASGFWKVVYHWAPVGLGVLPILGLAYGLWRTAGQTVKNESLLHDIYALSMRTASNERGSIGQLLDWKNSLNFYLNCTAAAMLILAFGFALLARRNSDRLESSTSATSGRLNALIGSGKAIICAVAATAALTTLLLVSRVQIPHQLGPIVLFALFIICLTALSTQFGILSHRINLPINGILVFLAIVFSLANWNDNHELRRIGLDGAKADPAKISPLPPLKPAFLEWYAHRPDTKETSADGRFPVYIVAAQGGGIYAATHTLMFLMRMQAACERFSQHLFAISGVSGGSVGAALYSAFARDFESKKVECRPALPEPLPSKQMGNAVTAAFRLGSEDYLSPLVAGTLFPDFAQRFLPYPIPSWSRERPLELAFETSWDEVVATGMDPEVRAKGNPLRDGFMSSWTADGSRPALLLNTTETGSGRRRVIAPFTFGEGKDNDLHFLPISREFDVPLSAAAIASARFPWLTPAAWFKEDAGDVKRIVDGGYFDNSGIATAMDLIVELEKITADEHLPIELHLIVLTSEFFFSDDAFAGLNELIAPVMALLNARHTRGSSTVDLAEQRLDSMAQGKYLHRVELTDVLTPLPLGWQLSRASTFQIFLQLGIARHCYPDDNFHQDGPGRTGGSSADCVKLLIHHQLRGDDLKKAAAEARERFPREKSPND